MKNKLYILLFASAILLILAPNNTCYAISNESATYSNYEYSIQSEETVWRYRIHNGKKQKRLWSYTTGDWVTDHWIDV